MQEVYKNGTKGEVIEGDSLEDLLPEIKKSLKKENVDHVRLFVPGRKGRKQIEFLKFLKSNKLHYEDRPDERIIEIEGVRFAYEFFKCLGKNGLDIGQKFMIVERKDNGTLTIQKLKDD